MFRRLSVISVCSGANRWFHSVRTPVGANRITTFPSGPVGVGASGERASMVSGASNDAWSFLFQQLGRSDYWKVTVRRATSGKV